MYELLLLLYYETLPIPLPPFSLSVRSLSLFTLSLFTLFLFALSLLSFSSLSLCSLTHSLFALSLSSLSLSSLSFSSLSLSLSLRSISHLFRFALSLSLCSLSLSALSHSLSLRSLSLHSLFSLSSLSLHSLFVNETEGRKNRIRPAFKEDMLFKRLTSHNHTAVHIPTDIYDGSTIVLNELNWTEALEGVFKKNREDDPTLLWQVFGSATGLARYYPASPWMDARKTPSKIDLYDVRRRPCLILWFECNSPCLNRSGSVSGLTLKLIRTSVGEMLETLSDDDYVNVVYFNTRVNNTACFDHLVQANVRNKKILKDAVQNISAKGITNYTKGFEFAFEQLYATNITRANCNKIIMLFTDGGEERASAILQKYNADKKVRIFTFSVGQHNYDKGPVQWMACANKGYFYEIPSIGAIRINTQEYLDVLGRPMVLADQLAKQVQWTNVYLDALELGLVITGTLPVFNKTKYKDESGLENQLILGVMGIDVSLDDIKKLTPRYTIGPNGYYFAIDPNGYVLLHPNLQPKVYTISTSSILLPHVLQSQLILRCYYACYSCSYDPTHDRSIMSNHRPLKYVMYLIYSVCYCCREYCKGLKDNDNNTQFLLDFNQFIDRNTLEEPCKLPWLFNTRRRTYNPRMHAHTYAHIHTQTHRWNSFTYYTHPGEGFSGGYMIFDFDFMVAGEEWTENAETYDSSFYKRTLDNNIYIFTAPYFNSGAMKKNYHLYFFCSTSCPSYMVVCVLMCLQCKDEICGCLKNNKHVDCVILDDGGFLLMSNQDEYITQIGQFFGEVDPVVMISLVNTSLYSFNKTYDYQSVCDPERDSKAAAGPRSVYVPTIADMLSIGWWASTATWSIMQQVFYGLIFPSFVEAVDSDDDMSANMFKESCITEQTQYFFDNEERSYSGVLDCGNCSRMYRAEKLPHTNLVFLITDAKATCLSCDPRPLRQAEQPSQGPDPCELAQNPRYRKGPDVCFDNNIDVSSLSLSLGLNVLHCLIA
uniref:Calcium voltage-gated channel auxiliary subunit alpha2delta 1 n=1 Tax=Oncorhynchus kisutch TaxID=8019 RepID=A0A8C7G3M3_ONCKI